MDEVTYKFVHLGFSLCAGGFIFLFGAILLLWRKVQAYTNLKEALDDIGKTLQELKDALLGNFQNKGLKTMVYDNEREITRLKETCERRNLGKDQCQTTDSTKS